MNDVDKNFEGVVSKIISFSLISTIIISVVLLQFAINHDYVFYTLYQVAASITGKGIISTVTLGIIETVLNSSTIILHFVDAYFILGFATLIVTTIYSSYRVKRMGYFSFLGFLTFGIIGFLFLSSIIFQISSWFKDIFIDGLLVNFSSDLPMYFFYMNHYGLINLIIISICLIMNFVDFDNFKFNTRKDSELINDEV